MNYINRFQHELALSFSVINNYSEYQLMHIFLYNFHLGGKYISQITSYQAELIREVKFIDQKSLSITSLQTDYLKFYSSSVSGRNNERENLVQEKCTFCGGTNHYAENFLKDKKG